MPRYTVDNSSPSSHENESTSVDVSNCELCGQNSDELERTRVSGATLAVCPSCLSHHDGDQSDLSDNQSESSSPSEDEPSPDLDSPDPDQSKRDSLFVENPEHWQENGSPYTDDPLPHLVENYGKKVTQARQNDGLQIDEFARSIGVRETDIVAIENSSALEVNISGSTITDIERELDISLLDE